MLDLNRSRATNLHDHPRVTLSFAGTRDLEQTMTAFAPRSLDARGADDRQGAILAMYTRDFNVVQARGVADAQLRRVVTRPMSTQRAAFTVSSRYSHRTLQLLERGRAVRGDQRLHTVVGLCDRFGNLRYQDTSHTHMTFSKGGLMSWNESRHRNINKQSSRQRVGRREIHSVPSESRRNRREHVDNFGRISGMCHGTGSRKVRLSNRQRGRYAALRRLPDAAES